MQTRILSAILGAPLLLLAIFWPGGDWPFAGWPFALFTLALIGVGLGEFYGGCRHSGRRPLEGTGYAAAALFWLVATPLPGERAHLLLPLGLTLLVCGGLAWEALRAGRAPLQNLAPTWLGALYVGWLFPYALRLRLEGETAARHLGWVLPADWMRAAGEGAWLVFFTLLVTSAVDTGAYFVGRNFGRRRLAPAVSPGKTWEGAAGGFAAALLVGGALAAWLRLPPGFAAAAAALIGVLAQVGDLAKSAIKREIGIKDFGALIPGHGGVLDRFDSLLFAAPTVYYLALLWR